MLVSRLIEEETKNILLAHLSEENNTPDTAYDACVGAVGDGSVQICIAHPEDITELITQEI